MFPLFETIRIADGIPQHLEWHERRMILARQECWQRNDPIHLEQRLIAPPEFRKGVVRCNVSYGPEIGEISYAHYEKKIIRSLKLVPCDEIDYHLKYTDRELLEQLLLKREDCDEIIIVKDGLITDTSMSNLILFDGVKWNTPEKPLLAGTTRERLLFEQKIFLRPCIPSFLHFCIGVKLINAMRIPEEEELIPIQFVKQ
jgi:4-amino-4-deoxychorismate lyase